jgi:transcriptional regulator with XRE-family HTH domain
MDAYALLAALEDARETRGSGIPLSWSDVAEEVGIHQAAFSRLKQGRLPGPRSLRALLDWLEIDAEEFKVGGSVELPIGGRDEAWDGEAATNRVFDWATEEDGSLNTAKLRQAFFFIDTSKDLNTRQAYKLPFTDVGDGGLHIVPRGMSAVSGGHGVDKMTGASKAEKDAIKRKICTIYKRIVDKYDDWPDCPFTPDGGRPERKERRNDKDVEGDTFETDTEEEPIVADEKKTAGIVGTGSLSQSEDPRTQALVSRVQELLREGAVAVSIKHDLHPDVSAKLADLEKSFADEDPEVAAAAMLEAQEIYENAEIRPRHVAIVDTAAFSNARLTLGEDGYSVSGPVTFEGIYTGDVRTLKHGSLQWDDELLPIPIIWDPDNNDHDGVVVGSISTLERVDGMETAVRPETVSGEDIEAVAAAAGSSALPAAYFADFKPTKKVPLSVGDEDSNGLRRIFGIAAPKGVCHRSDMGACFQYPGDVDRQHKGFHTGQLITLSDGTTFQPGALTLGGRHIDTNLARQGVGVLEVGRHRDDANTIFAMVRAWETPFGLAVSGIVMPDMDKADLMRAAASAPSVELWPSGRGRTLVGLHLVPTPAWPVAASAGGDVQTLTGPDHVHVLNPEGGFCAECGDHSEHSEIFEGVLESDGWDERMSAVESSLKRIEGALALLAEEALTNVPLPEDSPQE